MPIPEQALASKLQAQLLDQVLQEVEQSREERRRAPEAAIKEVRNRAERLNARLGALTRERDEAIRAWDERIARLKEEVGRAREEANEIERRIREEASPKPDAEPRRARDRKRKGG